MAFVEKREKGKWRARYRAPDGKERCKSFVRKVDADRFLAGVSTSIARGEWLDPSRGSVTLGTWAAQWLPSRSDLRPTSAARLESIVKLHVVPEFGHRRLSSLGNGEVRAWVGRMSGSGMSAASVRKALFALRSMLDAAMADRRITVNPAASVPLPAERAKEQRFATREEVATLADLIDPRYRALVLLGAYGGLRWGELTGLRRARVDTLRSRVTIVETAIELGGKITIGEPKTAKSRRVVPIARAVMREIEAHLAEHVGPEPGELVFTSATGGPLYRGSFGRSIWRPAVKAAGLEGLRIHDLRHSFVSIMTAAGANPKEVSTWAGHCSVAFTLDRYGHLYDDHADDVADRIDALLTEPRPAPAPVRRLGSST